MTKDSTYLIQKIVETIEAKKGENIFLIDVRELSFMVDYILLADGNVDRHVIALAQEVETVMEKESNDSPLYVQGMETGDWIVLDYFDIVVHLFTPDMRQKYQLERLWSDGKILNLPFSGAAEVIQ